MAQMVSGGRIGRAWLSAVELSIVHGFVMTARPAALRSLAVTLSWLGNGWAYLAIAVGSVVAAGSRALPAIAVGILNAGVLHCLYPSIKRCIGRPRPFQRDPTLTPLLRVLDEYSFPSGHAMTLSAALVPLVLAFPAIIMPAVAVWCLLAWARLASAHHYPSDVVAGAVLGVGVSYPLSYYALAASAPVP